MNTCDTCKWWKPAGPYSDGYETWIDDYGKCCSPRLLEPHNNHRPDSPPRCKPDGVSLMADPACYICCGPKFGCVHHETKP